MKKAFLIHGWEGHPEKDWWPYLKANLETHGFQVFVPAMPDTDQPEINAWLKHLIKIVGSPDKNCFFVGHSLGCITILRYLETLKKGQEIGGLVMVAGFTSDLGYEELTSFFKKPINWDKIKSHCNKFVAIRSDDDPYVSLHYGDFFKENLGAELIMEYGKKHFSEDEGITELPIALDVILKMSK